ncbi:MAG: V-type ATP synthase subunit F [Clostridia bacterium]|nr:V-type ATP synthase subunit F [Clostridia bacterium]
MYKIAVMGDRDSIYGFAALGFEIFPVDSVEQARKNLKTFADGEYAAVYITEAVASGLSAELEFFREKMNPAIIPIPGITGNTGIGMKNVSKSVEQAVGSDIIS